MVLELARGLSAEVLTRVAELESDSVTADGGRLKLEWSFLEARSGDSGEPEFLETPNDLRLVGERDGKVVATLRVYRSPEQWGIYGFAVDAQHRGQGIGRDLLRRVSRDVHHAGVTRMHLEVEVNNDEALGLYRSLGFTQSSTEDYFDMPFHVPSGAAIG